MVTDQGKVVLDSKTVTMVTDPGKVVLDSKTVTMVTNQGKVVLDCYHGYRSSKFSRHIALCVDFGLNPNPT